MTRAMFTRSVVALFAVLALVLPVRSAEEPKTASHPYVVLVGISNYADKQIKPRLHAEDDAKALYDVLTNKEYLGVDPKDVRLLLGSDDAKRGSQPATHENIIKALHWVAEKADTNDLVLFAFFGEGGPLGDSGDRRCYFASDSTFKGREKDAVAASDIGDALKNLKSHRFTAFIDVNFKGYDGNAPGVAEPTLGQAPYKEFLGDDGTEDHTPVPGRVVFLATNGLSTSLDLKDHGLFAQAIVEGLKGDADKDGYEPDGSITVDELAEYLDKRIPELARENGKTKQEKEQMHFVLGGRSSHYVLTHNPNVAAKVEARLAKLEKMKGLNEKYLTEGKQLLGRMPRLEAQRKLRKEYQALVDGKITEEKFEQARTAILDSMKMKRTDAADFSQKVLEVVDVIEKNYYKEVNKGDLISWAITGLYRSREEKVPEAIESKLKNPKKLTTTELNELLTDARQALGVREDLDKHKDIDITLVRMLSHLDPYTTYIDPESKRRFKDEIDGNFTGIGIQIRKDSITDMLLVITPLKGSPAYKAGLEAGDIITTITRDMDSQGEKLPQPEVLSTKGLPLNDAVKKILGMPGTKVKLTVQREGLDKPKEFEITRGRILTESVLGIKRKDNGDWDYWVDPKNKIAYIRLTVFQKNSAGDMTKVMKELKGEGIKGLVFDLRFNPGGLLDSAAKITDLFIDDGLIVTIKPRAGKPYEFKGMREGSLIGFPMVCLVNGGSASGSEIVSAALQDHSRAYIVGERSYGKGSVQNIMDFDGGDLKMTTATFWRPSGKNLNKSSTTGKDEDEWGVKPDKDVKLTSKERGELQDHLRDAEIIQPKGRPTPKEAKTEFKDKQLDEALKYLRSQIKEVEKSGLGKNG
jgi:carboxyl-terminal processing protease